MNRSKGVLLVFVSILIVASWLLLEPFLPYLLGAVLVAYVLNPLETRLEAYTSPMIAALAIVLLALVGLIVPFVILGGIVAGEAARILRDLDAGDVGLTVVEEQIAALTGYEVDIAEQITGSAREIGSIAFGRSIEAVGTISHFIIGVILLVFLVYYLIKDGEDFLTWLRRSVPLPEDVQRDLYSEIDDVMWAVLIGHVFVAFVQGGVAGIGLFVTGVPNAVFWTFVMMILAMVPIIGAIPVWGGAVVYLYLTGDPLFAVGLFVYSVVVVGLTDDYLRPFAVNRYADLNPAVILVGILGGGYAFGIMGLFFGPVILGALKATVRVVTDNWERLETTS